MKQKSAIKIWRYLPGILISILAVFFLSRLVNLSNLIESFRLFNVFDVMILIVIMIGSLVARGFVWKSLLDGISLKDAFLIINEGYLFNNLIPRSGEIARIFITSHLTKNDAFQAAAAIFFERAVDLLIAAGMFLSTLSLVLELKWLKTTAIWIIVVFSLMIFAVLLIAFYAPSIENFLQKRIFRYRIVEERIKPVIFRIIHGLTTINKPRKLLPAFAWIIITWSLWVMMLYYVIVHLSPGAPLWQALFTQGVVALGIALPSAPANLGVYEGTIVFALSVFGIKQDISLGAAIILHVIQISITVIFGLIGLFVHDFRLGQIIGKIQSRIGRKKITDQED